MRRALVLLSTATALLIATGCEHQTYGIAMAAPPQPLRLAQPETAYRLSPGDRAKLQPGFDAAALERLLGMVRPDMRLEVLKHFQVADGTGVRYGQLVEISDPALQAVLEEVWAPMWDDASDEQIEQNWYGFPGREIARQRRAAARARRPQDE